MMQMHMFVALFCLVLPLSVRAVDCFYPNGSNATDLVVCYPDRQASHCCRNSDVCLSNGLCFSSGLGTVVRRACTDREWKDSACLNTCNDVERFASDAVLTWCGSYGSYCCGDDRAARDCCNTAGNDTLSAFVGSGEVMCPEAEPGPATVPSNSTGGLDTCPSTTVVASSKNKSLETARNALIGVTAALGCGLIAAAALAILWRRRMKREAEERAALEQNRSGLEQNSAVLTQEKADLEIERKRLADMVKRLNAKLPPPLREAMNGTVNGVGNGGSP